MTERHRMIRRALSHSLTHSLPLTHSLSHTYSPSGFNIGTILNTYCSLNAAAALLSAVKKSKIPCIIQEELLSPGCTLAVKTTPTRAFSSLGDRDGAVTVSKSQELPVGVRVGVRVGVIVRSERKCKCKCKYKCSQ